MPPAPDLEAEASEWLIRLEADPSDTNKAEFERWVTQDSRRRAAFLKVQQTWGHADILKKLRPLDGEIDDKVLDKFFSPSGLEEQVPRRFHKSWWAVAAVLFCITLGTTAWMLSSGYGWKVYRTDLGGFQRVALEDGSTALLNTNSEIRVKLTQDHRQILLVRGEALFNVAHDATRPFDVGAAGTVVRAVGTAFSVRLRDQKQVDVLVTEGKVAIDPTDEPVAGGSAAPDAAAQTPKATPARLETLTAGEAVSVKKQQKVNSVQRIAAEDLTRKLAWTQGRIWFDRATLAEAVSEFNRYNRRQLVITDPSIANLRIGGAFDATDLDSFVAAMKTFGVSASQQTGSGGPGAEEIYLTRSLSPDR